jgi:L-asparaginase II
VLSRYFDGEVRAALDAIASHTMRNWNGIAVGDVRAAAVLSG